MALTVSHPYSAGGASIVRAFFGDNLYMVPFTFVPSSSYTTAGDAIATADMPSFGGKSLVNAWSTQSPGGYSFKLDTSAKTLLAYVADGGGATGATTVQVASTTNLQTVLGTGALTIFFYVH